MLIKIFGNRKQETKSRASVFNVVKLLYLCNKCGHLEKQFVKLNGFLNKTISNFCANYTY